MKKVTKEIWNEKALNFQKRITDNPYPKNIQFYLDCLEKLKFIGKTCLDVGCGEGHLGEALKIINPEIIVVGLDPFPRKNSSLKGTAESLIECYLPHNFETVFCFATLDNVEDLNTSLRGMKLNAQKNVVILTGIGIEPDHLHTVKVDRIDLVNVFGEPVTEIKINNAYLFEFKV